MLVGIHGGPFHHSCRGSKGWHAFRARRSQFAAVQSHYENSFAWLRSDDEYQQTRVDTTQQYRRSAWFGAQRRSTKGSVGTT